MDTVPPLACSVRDCGVPLARRERTFVCSGGHSFDVARSGYINLLQPQDRRSAHAGDSKAAVEARAALELAGIGRALVDLVVEKVLALDSAPNAVIVDLGSGTGETLGRLCASGLPPGIGIDLSVAASDFAARRFPSLTWVVGNADRRLPLRDGSVNVVLSIHGRRNPLECARVLDGDGCLLIALPAPDDLIELRALVQGQGLERDRVDVMLQEHEPYFQPVARFQSRHRLTLGREALSNLLRGTYRGARFRLSARVETMPPMEVTLSSEICLLKRSMST